MIAVTKQLDDPIGDALNVLKGWQSDDGSWPGDYGGPLFLLPMFVGTTYVCDIELSEQERGEIERYLRHHQRDDGSWGLHVEGHGHVFTTALCYVALRLLGVGADEPSMRRGREWLHAHGGPTWSASWGKFFLCILGLYDYEGVDPVPPELWLVPERLPIHPHRLWCHARMVYLPMSYLYGVRATAKRTPLLDAIRAEIHPAWPASAREWRRSRGQVASTDVHTPRTPVGQAANAAMQQLEQRVLAKRGGRRLRAKALDFVLEQIRYEDANTDFICIGPVNKLFHTLVWHFVNPGGPSFRAHVERLRDYLYAADDGTKMQGYNGSQLWDLTFACQAIVATGRVDEQAEMVAKAHQYLDVTQVREDVPARARCYRDPSRGGWPFSTRPHGWPITDCTAEGIKASLALAPHVDAPIARERLLEAVDLLLWWQNEDGGWATYERTRGPAWLELLNPSDCFGDIMIDYSYVECTSACLQALHAFAEAYPGLRDDRIAAATRSGVDFLRAQQRPDGSWRGSWGVCFTYGTWFGVLGLKAAGVSDDDPALRRACAFLFSKQLPDGGWGETPESCRSGRYTHAEEGQAVMTSWALLALMAAGEGDSEEVRRGLDFLRARQRSDGTWPPEHIAGVFNATCAIHYDNYLKIFPLWALAEAGR